MRKQFLVLMLALFAVVGLNAQNGDGPGGDWGNGFEDCFEDIDFENLELGDTIECNGIIIVVGDWNGGDWGDIDTTDWNGGGDWGDWDDEDWGDWNDSIDWEGDWGDWDDEDWGDWNGGDWGEFDSIECGIGDTLIFGEDTIIIGDWDNGDWTGGDWDDEDWGDWDDNWFDFEDCFEDLDFEALEVGDSIVCGDEVIVIEDWMLFDGGDWGDWNDSIDWDSDWTDFEECFESIDLENYEEGDTVICGDIVIVLDEWFFFDDEDWGDWNDSMDWDGDWGDWNDSMDWDDGDWGDWNGGDDFFDLIDCLEGTDFENLVVGDSIVCGDEVIVIEDWMLFDGGDWNGGDWGDWNDSMDWDGDWGDWNDSMDWDDEDWGDWNGGDDFFDLIDCLEGTDFENLVVGDSIVCGDEVIVIEDWMLFDGGDIDTTGWTGGDIDFDDFDFIACLEDLDFENLGEGDTIACGDYVIIFGANGAFFIEEVEGTDDGDGLAAPEGEWVEVEALNVTKTRALDQAPALKTTIQSTLAVYPNPVVNELTINLDSSETADVQVSIFNLTGQQIAQRAVSLDGASTQLRFDVSDQPAGMYLINVSANGETLHQTKFMKN